MPDTTNHEERERPSYAAFISYRHADNQQMGRQWATWLHQQIETYEVPIDLVGTVNERGEKIPERIFPVFRDEDELPADADLASPIYRALEASRFLVVICSPRAVASTYVNSEIAYFKRIGKSGEVLAAMIEGEPNSSWDRAKQAAGLDAEIECFPLALRHPFDAEGRLIEDQRAEPVAADFRIAGDRQGWTSPEAYRQALREQGGLRKGEIEDAVASYRRQCDLGKLKIIAGVLGVPLGTLTQRDKVYQLALAQKRARTLRRWLAAVGVLAVLAIGGALFGWWNERLAQIQKNLAVANAQRAETQRLEAVAAKEKAEQTLSRSYFYKAEDLMKAGRPTDALAYLARSLRIWKENRPAAELAFGYLTVTPIPRAVFEHRNQVTAATFNPDGSRVATASTDRSARVWDSSTGEPVGSPIIHNGLIDDIAFSPDGTRLLTDSMDKTARVWDTTTGGPVTPPILGADDSAPQGDNTACFNSDATRVLTYVENVARVWDAQTGAPVSPPLEHKNLITDARFSPDGRKVLTASADHTSCLWDAATGSLLLPPFEHDGEVSEAFFSPDGTEFATSGGKASRIWETATGRPLSPWLRDASKAVAFTPDGRDLLIVSGSTGYLFDLKNNKLAVPPFLHSSRISSAALSPDGTKVVTICDDGTARIWRTASEFAGAGPQAIWHEEGSREMAFESGVIILRPRRLKTIQFSSDGADVVTISEKSAQVRDLKSGLPLSAPLQHADSIMSATFSPDGREVLTASHDYSARIWSRYAGHDLSLAVRAPYAVCRAGFAADGKNILVASFDESGAVWGQWDLATGQPILAPHRQPGSVSDVIFTPDGSHVLTPSAVITGTSTDSVSFSNFSAQLSDFQSGNPIAPPIFHAGSLRSIRTGPDPMITRGADIWRFSFSPDGARIAVAEVYDHKVDVRDAKTMQLLYPALDKQRSAEFSPDGSRLVSVSTENTACIWDAATGHLLVPPLAHSGAVNSAIFSPDGTKVLTASGDRTARVWDSRTGQPVTVPIEHPGDVQTAVFSRDGRRIATASGGFVYIWDSASVRPVCPALSAGEFVGSAMFSPDGSRVATISKSGVRLWETDTGQEIFPLLAGESAMSFSPDGTKLMTVCKDGVEIRDLAPTGTAPDWLPDVLEAAGLQALDDADNLQLLPADQFNRVRRERLASVSSQPWGIFGRWLFSDPEERTLTPFATETMRSVAAANHGQ